MDKKYILIRMFEYEITPVVREWFSDKTSALLMLAALERENPDNMYKVCIVQDIFEKYLDENYPDIIACYGKGAPCMNPECDCVPENERQ